MNAHPTIMLHHKKLYGWIVGDSKSIYSKSLRAGLVFFLFANIILLMAVASSWGTFVFFSLIPCFLFGIGVSINTYFSHLQKKRGIAVSSILLLLNGLPLLVTGLNSNFAEDIFIALISGAFLVYALIALLINIYVYKMISGIQNEAH